MPKRKAKYTAKRVHPHYSIEQCPACDFPESDGGYCPDCGWMRPIEPRRYNSVRPKKW